MSSQRLPLYDVHFRPAAKAASRAADDLALSSSSISKEQMQVINGGALSRLMRAAKIRRPASKAAK